MVKATLSKKLLTERTSRTFRIYLICCGILLLVEFSTFLLRKSLSLRNYVVLSLFIEDLEAVSVVAKGSLIPQSILLREGTTSYAIYTSYKCDGH